jgi:hypothetical protein
MSGVLGAEKNCGLLPQAPGLASGPKFYGKGK